MRNPERGRSKSMAKVTLILETPIKVKESEAYGLVIEDAVENTHYFNKDGTYDGHSAPAREDLVPEEA